MPAFTRLRRKREATTTQPTLKTKTFNETDFNRSRRDFRDHESRDRAGSRLNTGRFLINNHRIDIINFNADAFAFDFS